LGQPHEMHLDVAQMPARFLIESRPCAAVGEALQHRPQFALLLAELDEEPLFGADLIAEERQALGQGDEIVVGGDAAFLAPAEDALQPVEPVGGLLEQRLDESGRRHLAAIAAEAASREPRPAREPFLEIIVEAVERETGLEVEKAENERPGK